MPLPFLKPKQAGIASIIVKNRTPDKPEEKQEDSSHSHAKSLISAIQSQDASAVASCIKEMFKEFDKAPHEEGPHEKPSPHSYESQKED